MSILPHGDVGRLVNSFASLKHTDATNWQQLFRQSIYHARPLPFLEQISGNVYLVATKHIFRKYIHAILLPDYRRIIGLKNSLTPEERAVLTSGGIPRGWYPQCSLNRLQRGGSTMNNYTIGKSEPLPWEAITL
tara:strand:+ start:2304 stop:2705 length:402 start_codon:yes stop_codon:yes gene_type:complete